ncbi:MAG: polymer-forming cytoskeletal protein [Rhodospirillaceae bacterium]|nr:polymer-forming cytoskeletal protein [Rhodospirillaceae bacterium]
MAGTGEVNTSKLIVGRDIILHGEIRACQNLVVEGRVEAALTDCRSIEIAASGVFKGSAHIQTADISGRFEGDLVVTNRLIVRSTGRIVGTIRYGQLEIERGGIVSGQIEVLSSNEAAHGEEGQGAERLIPAEAV